MIKKIFKVIPPIAINLIPLFGFLFFEWSVKGIFLFYAVEICVYEFFLLPRIVIFVFTGDEYGYPSVLQNLTPAIGWILYSLMMFGFTMMFILYIAFSYSKKTGTMGNDVFIFIKNNMVFIIFISAEYMYSFFKKYLYDKGYKKIPSQNQLWEIGIFFVIIQVLLGLFHIASVAFSINNSIYHFNMILLFVIFKTIIQSILNVKIHG